MRKEKRRAAVAGVDTVVAESILMKKSQPPGRVSSGRQFRVSKGKPAPELRDRTVGVKGAKPADEEKKGRIECASSPCYLTEIED